MIVKPYFPPFLKNGFPHSLAVLKRPDSQAIRRSRSLDRNTATSKGLVPNGSNTSGDTTPETSPRKGPSLGSELASKSSDSLRGTIRNGISPLLRRKSRDVTASSGRVTPAVQDYASKYENEYFLLAHLESWALLHKAVYKTRYWILMKGSSLSPRSPINPEGNAYIVIAKAEDKDDILADWKSLEDKVLPRLRDNPAMADRIDEVIKQLLNSGDIYPVTFKRSGSVVVRRVGKYKVIQRLGRGAFGAIRLAVDEETGQKVALKMGDVKRKDAMRTFRRESEVMRNLHHPNVVAAYQLITSDTFVCLVLEYCSGGDLLSYINESPAGMLTDREAKRITFELCQGINYLHEHGIIHRDIKPGNILLDAKRRVKVIDFGLARFVEKGNFMAKTLCGSPFYAAPELLTRNYDGAKADMWSIGVVLYNMVTGEAPYAGDPNAPLPKFLKGLQHYRFTLPRYVNRKPGEIIAKLMVLDPQQRAGMREILDDDWFYSVRAMYEASLKFNVESERDDREHMRKRARELTEITRERIQDKYWKEWKKEGETTIYVPKDDRKCEKNRYISVMQRAPLHFDCSEVATNLSSLHDSEYAIEQPERVEVYSNHTYVIYSAHQRQGRLGFGKESRDFVTLVHKDIVVNDEKELQEVCVGAQSVDHWAVPSQADWVRAKTRHLGALVTKTGDHECHLTVIYDLDLTKPVSGSIYKDLFTEAAHGVDRVRQRLEAKHTHDYGNWMAKKQAKRGHGSRIDLASFFASSRDQS
eukprot:Clim_evm11s54 gene=Clim_evmTU11s54